MVGSKLAARVRTGRREGFGRLTTLAYGALHSAQSLIVYSTTNSKLALDPAPPESTWTAGSLQGVGQEFIERYPNAPEIGRLPEGAEAFADIWKSSPANMIQLDRSPALNRSAETPRNAPFSMW